MMTTVAATCWFNDQWWAALANTSISTKECIHWPLVKLSQWKPRRRSMYRVVKENGRSLTSVHQLNDKGTHLHSICRQLPATVNEAWQVGHLKAMLISTATPLAFTDKIWRGKSYRETVASSWVFPSKQHECHWKDCKQIQNMLMISSTI